MNNPTSILHESCALCAPTHQMSAGTTRCTACEEKGDLVGRVVWDYVARAVQDAGPGDRVIYMLVGLPAVFLEGIARQAPNQGQSIQGRSLCLALNPQAAQSLSVTAPAISSEESAVHWRHSTAADVILFAPSDAEREAIGAGLGPLARIDGRTIEAQTEVWLSFLGEADTSTQTGQYLLEMLEGLRQSQIYVDLEMWVEFIVELKAQGFERTVDLRVQAAAPALHIPRSGIVGLPSYKPAGNPKAKRQEFRRSFQSARAEVAVYADLLTPKQEPVNLEAIREAIADFEHHDDEETRAALDATLALLNDEGHIRPGDWRESQVEFCYRVPWDRVGVYLFTGTRKAVRKPLGQRTLEYISGNFGDEVTSEDRQFLESLNETAPKDVVEDELDFFARWQERLNHPDVMPIYKLWQKRLFSKEVNGHDLVSTLSDAFEALIIAGAESLSGMSSPRVLVRAGQHRRALFWQKLDRGVQGLFRMELSAAQGAFGNHVKWDLEECFIHDAMDISNTAEHRKIELDLFLVEHSDLESYASRKTLPHAVTRVRAVWQPGLKPKYEPIALALPLDLQDLASAARNDAGVFRRQDIAARGGQDDSRSSSVTLSDVNSFSDVAQGQSGRTFVTTVQSRQDVMAILRAKVDDLAAKHSLDADAAEAIRAAIDTFEAAYKTAICQLVNDTQACFSSDLLDRQARAFGALCYACRAHVSTQRARQEIRPLVAELGLVVARGPSPLAIVTAWHPLRLAEWRARLLDLSGFIHAVLSSVTAKEADLTIAFEARRVRTTKWSFPQVALVDGRTMVTVEDVGGYSLLVPANCAARSQEAVESSTPNAAAKFIEGVSQYLEIHPHEATNLSAAIYDSESQTLPKEIARRMSQRLHRDPDLRCDLIITHHDQERMRAIYRSQNMRLGAETISEGTKGFLSRLRVDVRPNRTAHDAGMAIHDLDLVFLHDAISRHSAPVWDLERGSSKDLFEDFDISGQGGPRKLVTESNAPGVGVYLTLPRPPRAVAEYQDLLYEIGKEAVLPEGRHAILVQQVDLEDQRVADLVRRAHDMAEWVISFDKISSRSLLEKSGIQIIRDISVPGADARVIISAGRVDGRLRTNVCNDLVACCGIAHDKAQSLSEIVIKDVLNISGQKILSAARFANASREMIGLSIMRAVTEASLPADRPGLTKPIWFSLDDYRSWFVSGSGKVADAVAMSIDDADECFEILIQVGEAKFITQTSEMAETKDALQQVRDTVARLNRIFVENDDAISRAAWCKRLVELLVNRDRLSEHLPDPLRRTAFLDALSVGEVRFRISGDAVISLHDDHDQNCRIETDVEKSHLRSIILPTPIIKKILNATAAGTLLSLDGLCDRKWHSGHDTENAEVSKPSTAPVAPDTEEPSSPITPLPMVSPPSSIDGKLAEPSVVTIEPIAKPLSKSPDVASFFPAPFGTVLTNMAARETGSIDDPASVEWVEDVCKTTQRALSHFGMQAEFADPAYRLTPNGALITFRGHDTLTVNRISKRKDELLTTHGIEVIDIRPGRGKISLFVQREKRAKVPLASTWLNADWPNRSPGRLTNFILGAREDDDSLLYLNIAGEFGGYEEHGPHTLLAGETKSGKGVLTQSLLLQLITFNSPEEAKLILIDPKQGVDFSWIKSAPHLKGSIITSIDDAKSAINELVAIMDDRYKKLEKVGAPNIDYYNRKVAPGDRLSRIFLIHDEMGAWMAQEPEYREVVLTAVANLGMKARAAGIHLILITQRADAEAVPTKLRDNMGNRLCLKVQNGTGSRMVLGVGGAEKLLGKGHLSALLANESPPAGQEIFLSQVPYCEPDELFELASAAISYWNGQRSTQSQ